MYKRHIKKIVQVETVYLERQGLDNWKVTKYLDNQVNGLTYKEVIDLASQYDLATDFPGKSNYKITNYPPLTQAEIEDNRKLRENSLEFQKARQELDQLRENYLNSSIPEKIVTLENDIKRREDFIKVYKENGTLPAGTTIENVDGYIASMEKLVVENKAELALLKSQ
jgi:ParB-like chromosome segregation protein Spo0J